MPILGLSEQKRLPRLGKIHLGVKKISQRSGVEYPSATDYFVIPQELVKYFGERPTALPIMIPVEDDELWCNQYYKCYSSSRGLTCRGDGLTCRRMCDLATGEKADHTTQEVTWKVGLECKGRDCPDYQRKDCKETMNLQFIMPDVPGLGIWQVDTSSINSIRNINSAAAMIRAVYKRVSFIPLVLTLEAQEIINPDDGRKKTVHCLNLRAQGTIRDLMIQAARPVTELLLPGPVEDEPPMDTVADDKVSVQVPIISKEPTELPKKPAPDPSATTPAAQLPANPPTATKTPTPETRAGAAAAPPPANPATATKPQAPGAAPAPAGQTKPAPTTSTATKQPEVSGPPADQGTKKSTPAAPPKDTRTASRKFIAELKAQNISDADIKKLLEESTGKKSSWTADDILKARAAYGKSAQTKLESELKQSPAVDEAKAFLAGPDGQS